MGFRSTYYRHWSPLSNCYNILGPLLAKITASFSIPKRRPHILMTVSNRPGGEFDRGWDQPDLTGAGVSYMWAILVKNAHHHVLYHTHAITFGV